MHNGLVDRPIQLDRDWQVVAAPEEDLQFLVDDDGVEDVEDLFDDGNRTAVDFLEGKVHVVLGNFDAVAQSLNLLGKHLRRRPDDARIPPKLFVLSLGPVVELMKRARMLK